uniref:NADP-dependent oxidoreductase domain-containing protein n=1 Tax=Chromera velia CCMP2878 TaxID=1169474 RepID=A0A0G4I8X9_9ALVE
MFLSTLSLSFFLSILSLSVSSTRSPASSDVGSTPLQRRHQFLRTRRQGQGSASLGLSGFLSPSPSPPSPVRSDVRKKHVSLLRGRKAGGGRKKQAGGNTNTEGGNEELILPSSSSRPKTGLGPIPHAPSFTDQRDAFHWAQVFNTTQRNLYHTAALRTHPDLVYGMPYRRLAKHSNLLVSQLAMGTDHIGHSELIEDADAIEQMHIAYDEYGINFFDMSECAPTPMSDETLWGRGHSLMRKFFDARRTEREKMVVNCRLLSFPQSEAQWWPDFVRPGRELPGFSEEEVEEAIDGILSRTGLEYLDIAMLDWPFRYHTLSEEGEDTYGWGWEEMRGKNDIGYEEQIEVFEKMRQKGKIRHWGVSCETVYGAHQFHSAAVDMGVPPPVSMNVPYNLVNRNEAESSGLVEASGPRQLDIPIVAASVLAHGFMTGKYVDVENFAPAGFHTTPLRTHRCSVSRDPSGFFPEDWGFMNAGPANGKMNKFSGIGHAYRCSQNTHRFMCEMIRLARKYGMSMTELAFAFVYSRSFVASTIVGARTVGQLRQAVRFLNVAFPDQLFRDIHEYFLRYRAPFMPGPYVPTSLTKWQMPLGHSWMTHKEPARPFWTGGAHWDNYPQPSGERFTKVEVAHKWFDQLKCMTGMFDHPNDFGLIDVKQWMEDPEKPGTYFALSDTKLWGWYEKKFKWPGQWVATTDEDKKRWSYDDVEVRWENGTTYLTNATHDRSWAYTQTMKFMTFYKAAREWEGWYRSMKEQSMQKRKFIGQPWPFFDFDVVAKECREKHGINLYDPAFHDEIFNMTKNQITAKEWANVDHWDIHPVSQHPFHVHDPRSGIY